MLMSDKVKNHVSFNQLVYIKTSMGEGEDMIHACSGLRTFNFDNKFSAIFNLFINMENNVL